MPAQPADPVAGISQSIPVRTLPGTTILLSDHEIIWRNYRVVDLPRKKGEGNLFVTDSRVVFYARAKGRGTQRPSKLVQQTKLEDITGVAIYVSRRIGLGLITAAVLFLLLAVVAGAARSVLLSILSIVVTLGCVVALVAGGAQHGSVGVTIHSRATQTSPIRFGRFGQHRGIIASLANTLNAPLRAIFGVFTAIDVPYGHPGQDADQLVSELGALILDLQTRGSLAGGHWQVDVSQARARDTTPSQ
jgi:hypothetical protein